MVSFRSQLMGSNRNVHLVDQPISDRVHYVLGLVKAISQAGGSMLTWEAYAWFDDNGMRRVIERPTKLSPDQHFRREVRFARQILKDGGYLITRDERWTLISSDALLLTATDINQIIQENRKRSQSAASDALSQELHPDFARLDSALPRLQITTGPIPSEFSRIVSQVDGPAFTYIFRFANSDIWKIGYASDLAKRVAQVNQHVPIEILDQRWTRKLETLWPSKIWAYHMEQEILTILSMERTAYERVLCPENRLLDAWELAQSSVAKLMSSK